MQIDKLLKEAQKIGASDIHITVGVPPMLRLHGELQNIDAPIVTERSAERLISQLLYNQRLRDIFKEAGEVDFALTKPGLGRYRVNAFKQRGSCAAAMRLVDTDIPSMESIGLPKEMLEKLSNHTRGMVLLTGPTGSGKSTTLATMVDYINKNKKCHILTLEEPIEFLHDHEKSVVNQREIGTDSNSYPAALRAALREDPDVILIGEMRDPETISTAITAAETGHLVLSTLHTVGAAQTVDRIIDVFPPYQQEQIKVQLSSILRGVMSQQLLIKADGTGRCLAYEMMVSTPAISNLIREGKGYQIGSHIQTGKAEGMQTMDTSLVHLYKQGLISMEQVRNHAFVPDEIQRLLNVT